MVRGLSDFPTDIWLVNCGLMIHMSSVRLQSSCSFHCNPPCAIAQLFLLKYFGFSGDLKRPGLVFRQHPKKLSPFPEALVSLHMGQSAYRVLKPWDSGLRQKINDSLAQNKVSFWKEKGISGREILPTFPEGPWALPPALFATAIIWNGKTIVSINLSPIPLPWNRSRPIYQNWGPPLGLYCH